MPVWCPLQVDYESEDEDKADDGEDKEDQGEEEEEVEENVEKTTLEESQSESAGMRMERKNKRAKGGRGGGDGEAEEALNQMRVNSVLESNSAIERYCYDQQHELWCEVSLCMLHKQIEKLSCYHLKRFV